MFHVYDLSCVQLIIWTCEIGLHFACNANTEQLLLLCDITTKMLVKWRLVSWQSDIEHWTMMSWCESSYRWKQIGLTLLHKLAGLTDRMRGVPGSKPAFVTVMSCSYSVLFSFILEKTKKQKKQSRGYGSHFRNSYQLWRSDSSNVQMFSVINQHELVAHVQN